MQQPERGGVGLERGAQRHRTKVPGDMGRLQRACDGAAFARCELQHAFHAGGGRFSREQTGSEHHQVLFRSRALPPQRSVFELHAQRTERGGIAAAAQVDRGTHAARITGLRRRRVEQARQRQSIDLPFGAPTGGIETAFGA